MVERKNNHIESLRGLACLLLVFHHIMLDNTITLESAWKYFNESLIFLRLPLFTFISGYVYAIRPIQNNRARIFLKKKARRLLFPLLMLNPLYFVLKMRFNVTNVSVWDFTVAYFNPIAPLWYLQALLLVFCFVALIERCEFFENPRKSTITFGFCIAVFLMVGFIPSEPVKLFTYFSVFGAIYLLPFFLLGLVTKRFASALQTTQVRNLAAAVLVIAISAHQLCLLLGLPYAGRFSLLGLIFSTASLLLLINCKFELIPLAKLGYYSYPIYLFHILPVILVREVLHLYEINSPALLVLASLPPALLMPMIVEELSNKIPIVGVILLGKNYYRSSATQQA